MDLHRQLRAAAPLRQHCKPAIGRAAGLRDDALGDFLLEHQRQAGPQRRPCILAALRPGQPAHEQRGAHIIGQVGQHGEGFSAHQLGMIELERIALDYAQLAREGIFQLGQRGHAAAVHLDCGHAGAGAQQGARQPAGTRTHLEHLLPGKIAGHRGDPVEQLLVEQEVLPQRLGSAEAVAGDDFAQGRQVSHARTGWRLSVPPCEWRRSSRRDRRAPCARYQRRCHGRGWCARSAGQA